MEINFTLGAGDKPTQIVFGRGTEETDNDCRTFMRAFIENGYVAKGKVTSYAVEFEKCKKVIDDLWDAGVKVYGFPERIMTSDETGNALAGIWSATSSAAQSQVSSSRASFVS